MYMDVTKKVLTLKYWTLDYFERSGDDTYINIIGHRYADAVSINSQLLFWENVPYWHIRLFNMGTVLVTWMYTYTSSNAILFHHNSRFDKIFAFVRNGWRSCKLLHPLDTLLHPLRAPPTRYALSPPVTRYPYPLRAIPIRYALPPPVTRSPPPVTRSSTRCTFPHPLHDLSPVKRSPALFISIMIFSCYKKHSNSN